MNLLCWQARTEVKGTLLTRTMPVAELVRAVVVPEAQPQRPVNPIPATAYLHALASGGFTVRFACDSSTTTAPWFACLFCTSPCINNES